MLARPGWSTTSTTASPGACSRSSSPTPGSSIGRIGVLAALYPAVWGLGQLVTGGLSDRIGRKPLIVGGMLTQAVAIAWIAATTGFAAVGARRRSLLGAGTAMVYPTLLAAIGDVAHPTWRARSVGVYRLWRDGGFAVGALLAGILADLISHHRRDLGRRRPHRRVRRRRRRAHVRDPPTMNELRGTRSIEEILAPPGPASTESNRKSWNESGRRRVDRRHPARRAAHRDGALPDAIVIDRNVLEWRLDPACEHHIADVADYDARIVIVCNEGYQSSLAAALLHDVGLHRATDLVGGFQAWLRLTGGETR